jgi:putative Ca2+/H+ antiporter (TMEM165/GDT1 family)
VAAPASVALTAFATVLTAEMVGDRSLCGIGALAARLNVVPLLVGMGVAFMAKALAAVLLGAWVGHVAGATVSLISAASFLVSAALLRWREEADGDGEPARLRATDARWLSAAPVAFSSVFFTEWADVGQLTTAALTARYHAPLAVWIGASAALATKGALAVTLGVGLRRVLPATQLRRAGIALCLIMAGVSLMGAFTHGG